MSTGKWDKLSPGIETVEVSSAADFIGLLRRSNPVWWDGRVMPWAFRGHADANWALIPSAWRTDNRVIETCWREAERRFDSRKPKPELKWRRGNRVTGATQFGPEDVALQRKLVISSTAELIPIFDFLRLCDQRGLPTPLDTAPIDPAEDPGWLWGEELPLVGDEFFRFENLQSAVALAQHHGLPTRLLDWTLDPLVATFFAAEEGISSPHSAGIAVWALHRQKARLVAVPGVRFPHDSPNMPRVDTSIKLVRPTVRDNPYLAAQSGLFTTFYGTGIYFMMNGGERPALEHIVSTSNVSETILRKVVLTPEAVETLFDLLSKEGISRSSLMPTLDNIASEVRSQWVRGT